MQLADRYSTLDLRSLEVVVGNKAGTVFSSPLSEHLPATYDARLRMMWTVTVVQHKVKTNLRRVYDLLAIFKHLLILWKHAILTYYVAKKLSPAGLWYLGSAVALLISYRIGYRAIVNFEPCYIEQNCQQLRQTFGQLFCAADKLVFKLLKSESIHIIEELS